MKKPKINLATAKKVVTANLVNAHFAVSENARYVRLANAFVAKNPLIKPKNLRKKAVVVTIKNLKNDF